MRRETGQLWPASLAAAAAVAVSLPRAADDALWGDEVASARVLAEPSFGALLDHVRLTESTPPAWYALAWAVSTVAEPVERMRLLSVLFAAGAAALTALWATRLLQDRWLGTLAGLLVALGSTPAAYAAQLRAYALVALLSVVFGLLLVRVAARPSAGAAVGLAAATWAGAMTHYFFLFTAAAGGVWLWATRPAPPGRRAATLALGGGALAFLPWLTSFLDQRERGRYEWIGDFDPASVLTLPSSLFFGPDGTLYGVARIAVTAGLVVGVLVVRRLPEGGAVAALALLPLAGAAAVWSADEPIVNERNLLATAPYVAMLTAASLLALRRRARRALALAGLTAAVLGAAYVYPTLQRNAYDRVADELLELGWTPDDVIVVDLPRGETSLRLAVAWHLPRHPTLTHAEPGLSCETIFAVGHSSTLGPWLGRRRGLVEGVRELAFYDHPVRGRRDGEILVARLRGPLEAAAIPGDAFHVRAGTALRCLQGKGWWRRRHSGER